MKFTLVSLLFFAHFATAQQLEKFEYLEISYLVGGFNSKSTVSVDRGEKVINSFNKAPILEDSTGKTEFKTPMAAFNFLGSQGWEAIHFYTRKFDSIETQFVVFKRRRI